MRRLMVLAQACGLTLLFAGPAQAQLNGSHTLGDFGVQSGSQPQPGFYAALFYLRYDADTIKGRDGNIIRPSPSAPGSIAVAAAAPLAWYVSKSKILGANYGAMAVLPIANASIEAPAFSLSETVDTSVSDLLVRPLDLGWHTARADVTAGFQLYAPTGRYERGGSDNIGKGMWTYEPFVGTTVYFDDKRTVSVAATPTSLTLTWPLASAGFTVQSRTNLMLGNWVNVTSPVPQIIGGQWQVTLPVTASTPAIFYRLVK